MIYPHETARNQIDINSSGNIGIGTKSPGAKLEINSDQNSDIIILSSGNDDRFVWRIQGTGNDYLFLEDENDNNIMTFGEDGNVGIGTTNPQSRLAVTGKITAEEVQVKETVAAADFKATNTSWSDYVFDDDYNLRPLDQVETYIKQNKHLPDIPPAEQVQQDGIAVSEMLAKQMAKIEELTLYLIEMKKENEKLKNEVTLLKHRISE